MFGVTNLNFLANIELRNLTLKNASVEPVGLAIGQGTSALEVAIVNVRQNPTKTLLQSVWNDRHGGRAAPVLVVAIYGEKVAICGPVGPDPNFYEDLEIPHAEQLCRLALQEGDRHSAIRFLQTTLPEITTSIPGIRNMGLLATHELETGVPLRQDWQQASQQGRRAISAGGGRGLLRALGFEIEEANDSASILVAADRNIAVALFLDQSEAVDIPSERFSNLTPIAYALARADKYRLPYVVVSIGRVLRLYPVEAGVGVGQRGRTETFVQINLDLLPPELAGYAWLLFSADALAPDGTFEDILKDSQTYATDLGTRLRERIYDDVVPQLAQSLAQARRLQNPTKEQLAQTYQMALTVLFRLLFIAYAEDKELLPYKTNSLYQTRSLKQKALELLALENQNRPFDDSPSLWQEIQLLFDAIDQGKREWGIPPYNGGLFSSQESDTPIGAALKQVTLGNPQFGHPLKALLLEDTPDGVRGPVDFRSLSVREFGTIYEGLLQSELSIAQTDLTLDNEGLYVPTTDPERIKIHVGEIYLHNASGARKSTGSYYTKIFAVEHLLDHALEPALDEHLARLDSLDDRAAGEDFFDFRVADISMGSGHFLVTAIDRIERRFSTYLAERQLTEVTDELSRLRTRATEVMRDYGSEIEIEDTLLLRRQIARRCIYGVDLNPTAVELARLSIWIHTFVPGLPLSLLDYNLVVGNSLVGIATLQEALDLAAGEYPLFTSTAKTLLGDAEAALNRLGRLTDADAAEIAFAKQAYQEAREALNPTAALFDILTASRLNVAIRQQINEGRATLWVNTLPDLPNSTEHQIALEALKAIPPFHFPIAFPQVFLRERPGFDVILGNPPWEEATVEEDRFWVRYVPGLQGLAQGEQERLKTDWREKRPDLVVAYRRELAEAALLRKMLTSKLPKPPNTPRDEPEKSLFPGMGTGDPDVYKAFVWRFWGLVNQPTGRVGVVVPRSVFSVKGSTEFRQTIFQEGCIHDLTTLVNNRHWIFDDVHPQYTIALFSMQKTRPDETTQLPLRGPYNSLAAFKVGMSKNPVRFPVSQVFDWTDTAALPLLPSEQSGEVFAQIRKAPSLGLDDKTSWRARPYTELHATNDKRFMDFSPDRPEGFWAIYKGASFDIWQPDTSEYYAWGNPSEIIKELQTSRERNIGRSRSPFSEFQPDWAMDETTLPCLHPRVAFRDVSRATDSRTVRAALIPPKVFITNKGPFLLWSRGDERDQAYLLGVLCSIPLDWYARRFVEVSLNYHIFNTFPVPRPSRDNPLWQRTVELAGRLACPDERFADWAASVGVDYGRLDANTQEDMIAELDAVVAHLYGLDEGLLRHIFETFHVGWDYSTRLAAVLKHYNSWK